MGVLGGFGLAASLKEAEVRAGIKVGGDVLGAFIVELAAGGFLVYLRCSWIHGRQFRVLRTWRDLRGDRVFDRIEGAYYFIRRLPYDGVITIYPEGDRHLARFSIVGGDNLSPDDGDVDTGEG